MNDLTRYKNIKLNTYLGIFLVLLFGIPRFILVLQANKLGDYTKIPFLFILMIVLALIILTKKGRAEIGIKKVVNFNWLLYSFLLGICFCSILFFITHLLYNQEISNFFVYISNSYKNLPKENFSGTNRLIYFLIYAVTSATYSPIGEEFFYRGLVHKSFAVDFGENTATILDSLAFALTHLSHFGIVYYLGEWKFLFWPSIFWLIFMFLASYLFNFCKQKTGSIWGAVTCHAAFNLAMIYFIFYHIL